MKLKNGIEQTICILIMLETQDKAKPLKSYTISERLGISDSYLKKSDAAISRCRSGNFGSWERRWLYFSKKKPRILRC